MESVVLQTATSNLIEILLSYHDLCKWSQVKSDHKKVEFAEKLFY